ncbi:MAG: carbamoyltransferase HypF [Alphaproteobacteria bacterium]|nr:carbamoyltransferase HypF [Alphaproteobacteria bacterium]
MNQSRLRAEREARLLTLGGRVQGVGFRPFVYRLAQSLQLSGWVLNRSGRVVVHVEGLASGLRRFEQAIIAEAPPLARPTIQDCTRVQCEYGADFEIRRSDRLGPDDVHVPFDMFCCDDCLAELQEPGGRRFRYAFTNCTQCGPRYTLISALPYDRQNTAMAAFALCSECRAEYGNPSDRRFHAQPLACPDCGPQLRFEHRDGTRASGEGALARTVAALRDGGIVAVKGVGGYHLICDAGNDAAVARLRLRKCRPHKPLAVMVPLAGADGLDALREIVELDHAAAEACIDPLRPILLLRRRSTVRLSSAIAPGLDVLGVFLPYSPLHHILLDDFGAPVVATSGNITGEPVITDDGEAWRRLMVIADALLGHDRAILRPADDTVMRIVEGKPRTIRIGRGLAPLEHDLPTGLDDPLLAVGGHMKSTIALGWERRAVISPHIGELATSRGMDVFRQVVNDLQSLYRVEVSAIACDLHNGYAASRWAKEQRLPTFGVQHHVAHASALAGEYPSVKSWLVFTWDGVGRGSDGELWGGETLLGAPGSWRRVVSLRPFHLLGGEKAAREPWRSAAALLWEEDLTGPAPNPLAREAWTKRIGTHRSSSAGRLFDAAACLVLGLQKASFEGQGPMLLEALVDEACTHIPMPFEPDPTGLYRANWAPLLPMLLDDRLSSAKRSAIFHESLAANILEQVRRLSVLHSFDAVGLTGGVFQNRRLAERAVRLLADHGYRSLLPAGIPANDGGLAFGQLVEVLHGGGLRLK